MQVCRVAEEAGLKGGGEVGGGHAVDVAFAGEDAEDVKEVEEKVLGGGWEGGDEALVRVHGAVGFKLASGRSVFWAREGVLKRCIQFERHHGFLRASKKRKPDHRQRRRFASVILEGMSLESGTGRIGRTGKLLRNRLRTVAASCTL